MFFPEFEENYLPATLVLLAYSEAVLRRQQAGYQKWEISSAINFSPH